MAHLGVAFVEMSALGYVWFCVWTRRRDAMLAAALTALSIQGAGVLAGRGNCPLGPLQQRLGDPTPLFELILPRRAAKAAFPVLLGVTLAGVCSLYLRKPRRA